MSELRRLLTFGCLLATTTYGLASSVPTTVPRSTTTAETAIVKNIHTFWYAEGGIPPGELTLAADGNLYGINSEYGPINDGTMFRVAPGGAVKVVASPPQSVGGGIDGGLTLGPDHLLYGATTFTYSNRGGTICKTTVQGAFTPLYTFNTNYSFNPGKVTFGADGTLYGVTGNASSIPGTAYKLAFGGARFLTSFSSQTTGTQPNSLTLASDGNFYGTAFAEVPHTRLC